MKLDGLFFMITFYSKTCVIRLLSKRPKIAFQDQLSLNAGQKHCRMLQGEHSAILSTFINLPFVIKTFALSIFEWPFYTGFTVYPYFVYVNSLSFCEIRSMCMLTWSFADAHVIRYNFIWVASILLWTDDSPGSTYYSFFFQTYMFSQLGTDVMGKQWHERTLQILIRALIYSQNSHDFLLLQSLHLQSKSQWLFCYFEPSFTAQNLHDFLLLQSPHLQSKFPITFCYFRVLIYIQNPHDFVTSVFIYSQNSHDFLLLQSPHLLSKSPWFFIFHFRAIT